MAATAPAPVREKVIDLLEGRLSLDDFREWFAGGAWDARGDELARTIWLRLSEFSSGHWTEDELRDEFRKALKNAPVQLGGPAVVWVGGSSAITVRSTAPEADRRQGGGISPQRPGQGTLAAASG